MFRQPRQVGESGATGPAGMHPNPALPACAERTLLCASCRQYHHGLWHDVTQESLPVLEVRSLQVSMRLTRLIGPEMARHAPSPQGPQILKYIAPAAPGQLSVKKGFTLACQGTCARSAQCMRQLQQLLQSCQSHCV